MCDHLPKLSDGAHIIEGSLEENIDRWEWHSISHIKELMTQSPIVVKFTIAREAHGVMSR